LSSQESLTRAESLSLPERCSVTLHGLFSLFTGLLDLTLKLILLFTLKLTSLLLSTAEAVEIDLADIE
jgi:hypothetical protein